MDPLQWIGAVRMRVQTADKNIMIFYKKFTWLLPINSYFVKSCKFVMILTSSCCKSSIYKIAFYSGNVILSESGEKCSKIKHRMKHYYGLWGHILARSDSLKLNWLDGFVCTKTLLLHKMLIDGLESCGLLVMFLSAVWALILMAPIHRRGSNGEHVV